MRRRQRCCCRSRMRQSASAAFLRCSDCCFEGCWAATVAVLQGSASRKSLCASGRQQIAAARSKLPPPPAGASTARAWHVEACCAGLPCARFLLPQNSSPLLQRPGGCPAASSCAACCRPITAAGGLAGCCRRSIVHCPPQLTAAGPQSLGALHGLLPLSPPVAQELAGDVEPANDSTADTIQTPEPRASRPARQRCPPPATHRTRSPPMVSAAMLPRS